MDIYALLAGIREVNAAWKGRLALHSPVFSGKERLYVLDALESTFVSSVGPYVDRFERMLCEATGSRHAVACVNGTAALEMALRLAGVCPGDLVLTQTLTFVATANAVVHAGGEPVFLDVDTETAGLSPESVRMFLEQACILRDGTCRHEKTGRRVAACVPMHTFGLPCQIEKLAEVCARWHIPLVEDAAEALGSRSGKKGCGTFGLLGVLSFNGNKIITTGGGGAILTNEPELAARARHLTTTAKLPHPWEYRHDAAAWNMRMPNLNAALGCAQLERLDDFVIEKRRRAADYAALFASTHWQFLAEREGTRSNYWLCTVSARDRAERDAFLALSNAAGVMTRPVWEPLHLLPMYRHCLRDKLRISKELSGRLVNIPSGVQEKGKASGSCGSSLEASPRDRS